MDQPTSLFEGSDLEAFKESPEYKRVYKDYQISSKYPDFSQILASYLILLRLSKTELLSHPSKKTITIAHEMANLFAIKDLLSVYQVPQSVMLGMKDVQHRVQKAIPPPASQKVSFGLLLLPDDLLNGLDSKVNFIAFAQYRPGSKLPMDIYSDQSLVINPPPYFRQTYRVVFSCFSDCGSFYGGVRYLDKKGKIFSGDLVEEGKNNVEAKFIDLLWAITAQSLMNFELNMNALEFCPPKKRFLLF